MFITSREKSIIDSIIKTSGKHTPQSLASYLHVSVRTVQRDLKTVDNILKPFELKLDRTPNDGLIINGTNERIYKLIQQLAQVHPTDETAEEKKLQLLIILLSEGNYSKTQILAKELGVSVTTLGTYLDDLAHWLEKFSIQLTRKRGVGVCLTGGEANIRHGFAAFLLFYFHEELLDNLYKIQGGRNNRDLVLGYFLSDNLKMIDNKVHQLTEKGKIKLADNDYLALIVHIAITLQRVHSNFLLEDEDELFDDDATSSYRLMDHLCEELTDELSIPLGKKDIYLLTAILKGSKLKNTDAVEYDSIMLSQIMKSVIQDVSNQIHVDLTHDFSLFQGLLAHMEPAIFRLKHRMGLFNPLTAEIKKKYPVLFMAVRNSLESEFVKVNFPDDEVAFIVLHFGSALLVNEETAEIEAVIVCPTGIGTSKMLASRIQKEFVEINSITIKSIKELEKSNLDQFDLIISTVRLPFDDIHYIIVSPLLNDKDIQMIRSFLQHNIEKIIGKHVFGSGRSKGVRQEPSDLHNVLKEIKDVQTSIESIMNHFHLYQKTNSDYKQVLKELVIQLEKETVITDAARVLDKLEEREALGGLGIPDTNIGLYHCRDSSVKQLIFQIGHLEHPSLIKGMDGREMKMKNLLLMLSPEELSGKQQEILSLISTSIIENEMTMMIYSSSNERMVKRKLEELFSDYLKNKWVKE
ncbi:BglG family transcription antiterminator [Gracilibacillus oryzae]|uniref:BglG family transcription antiterminator n=1 Tax=Gracilibacillus oryzae TaxID=1672701 RepID=A0A7C8KUN0_9BACI|nr:BglG family transcription antiterminator [Gracilibacillus oryzae]KAB8139386.1 BglG family transcription antiterminator [Gracilibacillus oryzae]